MRSQDGVSNTIYPHIDDYLHILGISPLGICFANLGLEKVSALGMPQPGSQ